MPVAHPGQRGRASNWSAGSAPGPLFKRPAYFHWLLLPAFLALPVELYLYAFYGQGISTHHLGIIVETSPAEALEFLGSKVWLLGAVFIGVLAWFVAQLGRRLAHPRPRLGRRLALGRAGRAGLGVAVFGYGLPLRRSRRRRLPRAAGAVPSRRVR